MRDDAVRPAASGAVADLDDSPAPSTRATQDAATGDTLAYAGPAPPGGSTAAPCADAVVAERYRLVRCIGVGGMGSVWEAEHLSLQTPVAIKQIHPAWASDDRARARFVREARAAAALRSPHVVQILDYGVDRGTPFIAMELLRGRTLAARLETEGALSAAQTLSVVSDVCKAMAKAHETGLVHRDLKPDNIFLCGEGQDGDGHAKVLDFGIVKAVGAAEAGLATTHVGVALGTPYYMSPEQLMDASGCDLRSDLWSLAVIVFECLLGRRPFAADSMPELAVALLTEAAPVPSAFGRVPAGFDAWFQRATERSPERRFQSTTQWIDALRPVLLGVHAEAPVLDASVLDASVALDASGHPVAPRRWPRAAWVLGGLSVLAAVLGVVTLRGSPRADTRTVKPPIRAALPVATVHVAPEAEPNLADPAPRPDSPRPVAAQHNLMGDEAPAVPEPAPGPVPKRRRSTPRGERNPAAPAPARTPRPGFDPRELEHP